MQEYNLNEISKYLMYFNANNLYGWAIIQKLPQDDLKLKENILHLTVKKLKKYIHNKMERLI